MVGNQVVTRREKIGTIVDVLDGGDLMVQFGRHAPIRLRPTQVITLAAFRAMVAGRRQQARNQLLNGRVA